jgi:hypothetical protein
MQLPDMKSLEAFGKTLSDKMHVTIAPDVTDGGVTYGAITTQIDTAMIPGAPAVGPQTLTCTYDKQTYLMHSCTNGVFTETMSGYNDPANVVTVPADALNAPLTPAPTLPAPAPSASP